jgi:hypothetical protein
MGDGLTGNGFEIQAGPAQVRATGSTVINVLLAILIIASSGFVIYVTNQQTMMIQSEHRGMLEMIADLKSANENVFLSTILTPEQKQNLPSFVKEKARSLVERKATETVIDK